MDRRKVTIIIAVIVLLLVAAILAYFLAKPEATNTNAEQNNNQNVNIIAAKNANIPKELSEEEKARNTVTQIATIFAERYGTYTNTFDIEDVKSVKSFVTETYGKELDSAAAKPASTGSIEISAQVLNVKIESLTLTSSAVARVSTLRRQSNANNETNVVTQDLSVRFVKVGDAWKVDGSSWGKAEPAKTL